MAASTTTGDLASALAALEDRRTGAAGDVKHRLSHPAQRAILTVTFVILLIGGAISLLILSLTSQTPTADGSRASIVFSNAQRGACLNWPPDAPDEPSFVQCRADHMFEVAKPVGMNGFGEPCQFAVREYLGTRYDPNSRFTISVLWAGDADGMSGGPRNLLCGLQLLGPDGRPIPFKGVIAELDQSKVWPVGTCLGIDSANRSTDIPVDCSTPHGVEVTDAVSLAKRFSGEAPAEPDQRAYLADVCTRAADAYLAPSTLTVVALAAGYEPLSPASWSAGSRQVACTIGKPGERGWSPVVGSARTRAPADVPSPQAAPTSPPEVRPPPVYGEALVQVAPVAPEAPPPPPSTDPPPPVEPPVEPPPPPSGSAGPPPGVIEIPGLPPIFLPGYVPPPPAPPPAPPPPA